MQQSSRPSIRLYCPYYTHTYLESFLSSQYLYVIPFTFKFGNINEITRLKLRNWNQIRPPQFLPIKNSWERRMWWGRPYNLRIFPAYIPWRNATHCHPCIRAELLHLYKKKQIHSRGSVRPPATKGRGLLQITIPVLIGYLFTNES